PLRLPRRAQPGRRGGRQPGLPTGRRGPPDGRRRAPGRTVAPHHPPAPAGAADPAPPVLRRTHAVRDRRPPGHQPDARLPAARPVAGPTAVGGRRLRRVNVLLIVNASASSVTA